VFPLGHIMDIASSYDGLYLCTVADDQSLKVFDVINFGMHKQYQEFIINICRRVTYTPVEGCIVKL